MLSTSDRIGWRCWFRAIYSLFRALCVARLSCYIHVPTVAKSSLPILVSANEPHGTSTSLIHTVQSSTLQWSFIIFCTAVKIFWCAVQCSSDSWEQGDYIFIRRSVRRQVGWGGGKAAELHSHQGEGRKRQIALPEIIYNLLRKQSSASRKNPANYWLFLYKCYRQEIELYAQ